MSQCERAGEAGCAYLWCRCCLGARQRKWRLGHGLAPGSCRGWSVLSLAARSLRRQEGVVQNDTAEPCRLSAIGVSSGPAAAGTMYLGRSRIRERGTVRSSHPSLSILKPWMQMTSSAPLVRAGMGNSKLLLLLTLRSTTTIHDSHHFHPPVLPLVVHRSRSPSDVNIKEGDDCYLRYLATTDPPR